MVTTHTTRDDILRKVSTIEYLPLMISELLHMPAAERSSSKECAVSTARTTYTEVSNNVLEAAVWIILCSLNRRCYLNENFHLVRSGLCERHVHPVRLGLCQSYVHPVQCEMFESQVLMLILRVRASRSPCSLGTVPESRWPCSMWSVSKAKYWCSYYSPCVVDNLLSRSAMIWFALLATIHCMEMRRW